MEFLTKGLAAVQKAYPRSTRTIVVAQIFEVA